MIAQLALVAFSGVLGSAHCLGMCGGFALMVGLPVQGTRKRLWRQLAYSGGRIVTYAMLGGLAGYAGVRLSQSARLSSAVNVAAALSILCGLLLTIEGLLAAGVRLIPRRQANPCGGCLSTGMFSAFLRTPGLHHAFLAGTLTGFLPCGLVYGFLALSAAQHDPLAGMAVMTAFGLGTVPLMVAGGMGAAALSVAARRKVLRIAALCVVATGLSTAYRGYAAIRTADSGNAPSCPFCAGRECESER
jgi:uncharacterized protein